jgi:hypothetical protein
MRAANNPHEQSPQESSSRPPATNVLIFPGERVSNRPAAAPASRSWRGRRTTAVAAVAAAVVAGVICGAVIRPFDAVRGSEPIRSPHAAALERLDERRTVLRAQLSTADTPQQQAAIAARLSDAYAQAAQMSYSRQVTAAARAAERAYAALAVSAAAGSRSRFQLVSDDVGRAERRIAAAVEARP